MYLLAHLLHICIMYCSRFKKMDNININYIILLYYISFKPEIQKYS